MDADEPTDLPVPSLRPVAKAATQVRSTLIMSSQKTLRDAGLFDEYVTHLAPEHKHTILEIASPVWLPIATGMAHYQACDQLGLTPAEVTEMAQRVSMNARGTFLGVAFGLARSVGVTPWTVLGHAKRIWERAWVGGAMVGYRLGQQEMRVDVVGWPCARIPYCRHALRGILLGVVSLLSKEAYVRELPDLQTGDFVAYRVVWR